jgi:hypothetical protein
MLVHERLCLWGFWGVLGGLVVRMCSSLTVVNREFLVYILVYISYTVKYTPNEPNRHRH